MNSLVIPLPQSMFPKLILSKLLIGKQTNGLKPLDLGKVNDNGASNPLTKKVTKNANDNEDDSNFLGSKLYTSYRGSTSGKKEV